ncbi:MAG: helix-turn-helix domain-containing protein [Streptosporangiales bacterium]|nr:helix-turn-helix domain-containing protein [Streptosporangiales bacterium]
MSRDRRRQQALSSRRHRVVVLALDGVIPFELGIPSRIFGARLGESQETLYDVVTCAAVPGRVDTDIDVPLVVERGPEELATADTVVVPATHRQLPELTEGVLSDTVAETFAHLRPGTRVISICTASFIVAATGMLDGRRATTHWMHAARFQRLYPKVRVDPDVLFVDEGDVLTSAGVAAGLDLCLHVVRRDHGVTVANRIARQCVVPPWRDGGQAQYVEHLVREPAAPTTAAARAWALERLGDSLSLADLAEHAGMSVRSFTRRFRAEMGTSPGQWLTSQRVELARQLLEGTDLPVDSIARRAGFGTAASLRQHLGATLGVAPATYRRTFRPVVR